MRRFLISAVLFVLAGSFIAWAILDALPRTTVVQAVDTSGHEAAKDGALLVNGWLVANWGNAKIMDTYLRYREWLGPPISSFNGQAQSFQLGRLTYNPGNTDDWKVEFANLGEADLRLEGYTPKPGSAPHPALRDWLLAQMDAGLDVNRVVGRVISDPVVDPKTGICRQWTDKQLFIFDKDALTWDKVHRAPLGLWMTYTKTKPMTVNTDNSGTRPNVLVLLAGAGCAALALLSLKRRGGGAGSMPV